MLRYYPSFDLGTDYTRAEAEFDKILSIDPERIDDIDIYSNILYVLDSRLKLSRVAHEFLALEKDRPEVCCLIGKFLLIGLVLKAQAVKFGRKSLLVAG